MRVLVGMSGGVDSSVASLILKEQGFEVCGMTLMLCEEDSNKNSDDAKSVCEKLDIDFRLFDLREMFRNTVIRDFIENYREGLTPNPCIICNKYIKFGEMLNLAEKNGFDKIATGHYAKIEKNRDGRFLLKKAADISKDQTYVLYTLTQAQLSKLIFPLGEMNKTEIRKKASNAGLINSDRPDSQDICFVPDGDYAGFINRCENTLPQPGNYIDVNGNILGKHCGIINYTVGQRKGLGIALGKPQFVIEKSVSDNTVTLGDEELLFKKTVKVTDVNFIPFDRLEDEMRVTAKLRYRQKEQPALLIPEANGDVTLIFDQPQRAPSPGQSAVFYDGDTVVGGGIIYGSMF